MSDDEESEVTIDARRFAGVWGGCGRSRSVARRGDDGLHPDGSGGVARDGRRSRDGLADIPADARRQARGRPADLGVAIFFARQGGSRLKRRARNLLFPNANGFRISATSVDHVLAPEHQKIIDPFVRI